MAHPSEANYIAMLGGDTFGIHDDDAWYCEPFKIFRPHCAYAMNSGYATASIAARSLMDQLAEAKLTWKGYFEDLPEPGSLAIFDPSAGQPRSQPARCYLYAAKHNGFINFEHVRQDPASSAKIVPLAAASRGPVRRKLPNFAHIVLNQCDDMHGLYRAEPSPPADCVVDHREPERLRP